MLVCSSSVESRLQEREASHAQQEAAQVCDGMLPDGNRTESIIEAEQRLHEEVAVCAWG